MHLIQFIQNKPGILIPLLIWSLCWKGFALWRAGRNNQPVWFVACLVVNTVGLLEIVYLAFFQKKRK
jgi:hypothetical protein